MRRTQIWCDTCGKQLQDKRSPKGSGDFDSTAKAWEFWSPDDDHDGVYCSIPCLIKGAQELHELLSKLEQPLGEVPRGEDDE